MGVVKGQKSFEKGSLSYAIDYGVGGKSPLEPSFNFCVELCDNSKVSSFSLAIKKEEFLLFDLAR